MVSEETGEPSAKACSSRPFLVRDKSVEPIVDMVGINHAFGQGESRRQVLFGNSLKLYPGEIVIMTGPSGSGKTTLLTLVGGLRSLQEGSLVVMGRELRGVDPNRLYEIRRNIGFIFQAHNLFESLTGFQTLVLAMQLFPYSREEYRTRPAEILRELDMEERMHYKPENLSGGQRQRVAIGRALINHPRLILADEPTAALDKDTGRKVVSIFQKRAREEGCTIIIVTHDNRILDVADRIISLVDGRIVSDIVVADSIAIGAFLEKCPVFQGTNPTLIAYAATQMRLESFGPGELIIREGEEGDKFYLVRSGEVEVFREDGARKIVLARLCAGDFFGELALLRQAPRAASVAALEEVQVFSISKKLFDEMVRTSSSFREQLTKVYFNTQML